MATDCQTWELLQFEVLAGTADEEELAEWDAAVEQMQASVAESGVDITWNFMAEVTDQELWGYHATLGWWCAGIEEVGTADDDQGFSEICKDQGAINALASGLAAARTVIREGNLSADILIDASTPDDLDE